MAKSRLEYEKSFLRQYLPRGYALMIMDGGGDEDDKPSSSTPSRKHTGKKDDGRAVRWRNAVGGGRAKRHDFIQKLCITTRSVAVSSFALILYLGGVTG